MHLIPATDDRSLTAADELEVLFLSERHLTYLGRIVQELNPDMPASIGLPHLIRTILDRAEQSGVDLTDASSEEDIVPPGHLAAAPDQETNDGAPGSLRDRR